MKGIYNVVKDFFTQLSRVLEPRGANIGNGMLWEWDTHYSFSMDIFGIPPFHPFGAQTN